MSSSPMPRALVLAWPQDPYRMVVQESQKSRVWVGVGWRNSSSHLPSAMETIVALGLIPLDGESNKSPTAAALREQVNAIRARLRQFSTASWTEGGTAGGDPSTGYHCHVCLSGASLRSDDDDDDNPNELRRANGSYCCHALLYRSNCCWQILQLKEWRTSNSRNNFTLNTICHCHQKIGTCYRYLRVTRTIMVP
jgi:hypothetical protein